MQRPEPFGRPPGVESVDAATTGPAADFPESVDALVDWLVGRLMADPEDVSGDGAPAAVEGWPLAFRAGFVAGTRYVGLTRDGMSREDAARIAVEGALGEAAVPLQPPS